MFQTLLRKTRKLRFGWLCRGILDTPPIRPRPAPLRIVSMVRSQDRMMYLVAIKSFYRHLPGGEIVIIDDGTLTERDRELLRHHLGGPSFVRLESIRTDPCPRGGCWERLLHILDLSHDSYVIQMDSDTLTTGPVPEVVAAVRDNRAFTLNSGPGQPIVDLEAAAAAVADHPSDHMQILAERALPRLPAAMGRRYVRGSAGFAGFARGGATRETAEAFSAAMQAMLGARWEEWGSEQVTSNYLVCNSPGGMALPWPKYCCFYPGVAPDQATMLHFIGSWRFNDGVYVRKARQVIAELSGRAGGQAARRQAAAETAS
ncbi:hypothetical protein [Crenalkalicoccus roseus]|uniref:hypothetical protein n=1 Tax=Crenalkalicoccus roseus TaxID=1485588 RepID=UPI001081840B|nr:hypothetical protein [Crenalkalicoccus roseus]